MSTLKTRSTKSVASCQAEPSYRRTPGNLAIQVGNDIDEKIRLHKTGDLHHVLVQGVAPLDPRGALRVRTATGLRI